MKQKQNGSMPPGRLARDKMPEILRAKGEAHTVGIVADTLYRRAILSKIRHELRKFEKTDDLNELINIQELLRAILEERNCSWIYFGVQCVQKKKAFGGFKKGFVVKRIETPEKK